MTANTSRAQEPEGFATTESKLSTNIVSEVPKTTVNNVLKLSRKELTNDIKLLIARKGDSKHVANMRIKKMQNNLLGLENPRGFKILSGSLDQNQVIVYGNLNTEINIPFEIDRSPGYRMCNIIFSTKESFEQGEGQ